MSWELTANVYAPVGIPSDNQAFSATGHSDVTLKNTDTGQTMTIGLNVNGSMPNFAIRSEDSFPQKPSLIMQGTVELSDEQAEKILPTFTQAEQGSIPSSKKEKGSVLFIIH